MPKWKEKKIYDYLKYDLNFITQCLFVLLFANLYATLQILPTIIQDDVFRIPNTVTNLLVDRVSTLKRYDLQLLINDALMFDSIIGETNKNSDSLSTSFDPEVSNPQYLMRAYDNPSDNGSINDTSYYVRPEDSISDSGELSYYMVSGDYPY